MTTINPRPLKGFVRYDGGGRVVPTSLVLRKNMPKVGRWVEVPLYECCNTTTSTTTGIPDECVTYLISIVSTRNTYITFTDCYGNIIGPIPLEGPLETTICAVPGSLTLEGDGTAEIISETCIRGEGQPN